MRSKGRIGSLPLPIQHLCFFLMHTLNECCRACDIYRVIGVELTCPSCNVHWIASKSSSIYCFDFPILEFPEPFLTGLSYQQVAVSFHSVWLLIGAQWYILQYPYIHNRKGQNIIVLPEPVRLCGVYKIYRDVAFLESLPFSVLTIFYFAWCLHMVCSVLAARQHVMML